MYRSVVALLDWFVLGNCGCRAVIDRLRVGSSSTLNTFPHQFGDGLIDGTGVSFLLGDAKLGQHLEDDMRGNLDLPC